MEIDGLSRVVGTRLTAPAYWPGLPLAQGKRKLNFSASGRKQAGIIYLVSIGVWEMKNSGRLGYS